MRSALTTIGIIIGVAAVIAMVEISNGSKTALMQTMSTMGANNLLIQSGAAASGGVSWGLGSAKTLTPQDAIEIGKQCENVEAVAPIVQVRGQIVRGNKNWTPQSVYGTTPDYLVVRDWTNMDSGHMFSDQDVRGSVKTCVIGRRLPTSCSRVNIRSARIFGFKMWLCELSACSAAKGPACLARTRTTSCLRHGRRSSTAFPATTRAARVVALRRTRTRLRRRLPPKRSMICIPGHRHSMHNNRPRN